MEIGRHSPAAGRELAAAKRRPRNGFPHPRTGGRACTSVGCKIMSGLNGRNTFKVLSPGPHQLRGTGKALPSSGTCPHQTLFIREVGGLLAPRPTHPKKILSRKLAEGKQSLNQRPFVGPSQNPAFTHYSLQTKPGPHAHGRPHCLSLQAAHNTTAHLLQASVGHWGRRSRTDRA